MSKFIMPILVLFIIIYGFIKKIDLYDSFVKGSIESFKMSMQIFPYLLGMMLAIQILLNSNILLIISKLFVNTKIPFDIIPMALMRPISGSSTLAILNNIYKIHGPDSFVGRLASVIQGSTDTTFYVITLYFGSVGIKKIRHSLIAGLFADLIGITSSIIIVKLMF